VSAALEKLINPGTYQYPSDFARKYIAMGPKAEGEARGKAEGMAQTKSRGRSLSASPRSHAPPGALSVGAAARGEVVTRGRHFVYLTEQPQARVSAVVTGLPATTAASASSK
jgi:hypothetical protein